MAQVVIYGILAGQTVNEKTGNARLTLFDIESKRMFNVSLMSAHLPPESLKDVTPRRLVLDDFQQREWEGKMYVTCAGIVPAGDGKK